MPKLEGFSLIPNGTYPGTITGVEYRNSASNDNPMLVIEVALATGQLVNMYCVLDYAGKNIKDLFAATGITLKWQLNKVPDYELDNLIGRKIAVVAFRGTFSFFRLYESHYIHDAAIYDGD